MRLFRSRRRNRGYCQELEQQNAEHVRDIVEGILAECKTSVSKIHLYPLAGDSGVVVSVDLEALNERFLITVKAYSVDQKFRIVFKVLQVSSNFLSNSSTNLGIKAFKQSFEPAFRGLLCADR